jgi:hypothetical protein
MRRPSTLPVHRKESRMKDKKLEALIRKVSGKPAQKSKRDRFVDPTLKATRPPESEGDEDRKHLFKEMKRREF